MSDSAVQSETKIFGSGEMADLIRAFDWSTTPLGAIEQWPETLLITVNTMLANRLPNFLFWGGDLIQFYNDAFRPSIGFDKHPRALGQRGMEGWAEIWHIIGPQIDAVMSRGESCWFEDQLVPFYRNGKLEDIYWTYSYSPVRDTNGAIMGTLVSCHETTGRVLAERALRSEQNRLLSLFQQAPAFLAVLRGPNHVFELHNPPYMDLIGHRDVLGKNVKEALPEAEKQGFIDVLDRVYESGEPFVAHSYPIDLERSSGRPLERRYLDFVYQAMREPDGTISGVIALGVDVTERKTTEDALRNSEKLAVVGRLAASIAHEINNPLEAVTNLIYLGARATTIEDVRMYLATAQQELNRVTNIATQTLRFHRQSTRAAEASLADVMESVLALFQGRIANAGVSVERQYETPGKIVAYEGDVRQVFANLVSNALDASHSRDKIVIRVRDGRDFETGERSVRVTIADTGSGMTDETRRHMFDAFFTTKSATGTGLGLWVSSEILKNHQAKTYVRSSQDPTRHGTVISISFPKRS